MHNLCFEQNLQITHKIGVILICLQILKTNFSLSQDLFKLTPCMIFSTSFSRILFLLSFTESICTLLMVHPYGFSRKTCTIVSLRGSQMVFYQGATYIGYSRSFLLIQILLLQSKPQYSSMLTASWYSSVKQSKAVNRQSSVFSVSFTSENRETD